MLLNPDTRRIIGKELTIFFASPMAYIFLAAFAIVTLFSFFWVEGFFTRNIADVRPLFEWMPILLIFLSSTLTMRLWSEEKRMGTVEHVLTQPTGIWSFVLGKFLACVLLLGLALLITLPIPISVSFIGDIDWGPIWSGYLSTFLLGSAYISLGLFVSARSDNQIVSLISSVLICSILYLIGSPVITGLFDNVMGDVLRFIGTGARFEFITRGIIDVRDLYYYISLMGVGLMLNVYVLEKSRWSKETNRKAHRTCHVMTILVVTNLLFANVWLNQVNSLRYDTTEGKIYSISKSTTSLLTQLQEPLLIRGYFSSQTHPLLAPLVPQIIDLIEEYEVAGDGSVKVEIIDPADDPALEDEANNKYSIRPTPFQVSDRYQTSVVNSYFNILLQYGNEYKNLSFQDLIEIKQKKETEIDVLLRNPEYDITNAINKIVQAYQSAGDLFAQTQGVHLRIYASQDDKLPKELQEFKVSVLEQVEELKTESKGKFTSDMVDPASNNGAVAEQIDQDYGFKPMVRSLADSTQFFFYMLLVEGEKGVVIPLGDLQAGSFDKAVRSSIKRLSSGYTKTIGLHAAKVAPSPTQFNPQQQSEYQGVISTLRNDLNVRELDLSSGVIDGEIDLLVLLGITDLDEKQLFAVDQYLMRGGTIISAASPYTSALTERSIDMRKNEGKFIDWLANTGLSFDEGIVMDEQSAPFPIPVTRNVNGFEFQQMQLLQYPYFSDIRDNGLNKQDNITNSLRRVVMAWGTPIIIDETFSSTHKVVSLLKSSELAWQSTNTNVVPKLTPDGKTHFEQPTEKKQYDLGVSVQGRFDSWFADKESPLLANSTEVTAFSSVVSRSPESAKIILFSSNEFLKDRIMSLIGAANRTDFRDNIDLIKNTVDVSLEGNGLQDIRARGNFNRTLPKMEVSHQQWIEYGNYILALLLLTLIALGRRAAYKRRLKSYIMATKA